MKRNVLFVVYNFPPAGGAGVQRSLKFVKYLPQFGWQPVVITATPDGYPVLDKSMLTDVPPGTPIYRIRGYDINRLRPILARFKLGKVLTAGNLALRLPDTALFWKLLARSTVRHAIERHHPCMIYSSSAPESAHLLGLWTQRNFELPWIADFRDLWTENPITPYYPGYRALNSRLERQVLAHTDRALTVSHPLADRLQLVSRRNEPFTLVIENGYDEKEVAVLPPPRTNRFTISHAGTFSRLHRPDAFVTAIDQLLRSSQVPLHQIRVVMAGRNSVKYVPSRPPFEHLGYLNHDALNDLRRRSNLLLLTISGSLEHRGIYGGKVFEHLGCNRPTLAITHPDNVAARLIERARAGVVCCHNPTEIASAILLYYHTWQTGNFDYTPDWNIIRQYTRRNLTARLAAEFDRLVAPEETARWGNRRDSRTQFVGH